jgi:hypothetical protein
MAAAPKTIASLVNLTNIRASMPASMRSTGHSASLLLPQWLMQGRRVEQPLSRERETSVTGAIVGAASNERQLCRARKRNKCHAGKRQHSRQTDRQTDAHPKGHKPPPRCCLPPAGRWTQVTPPCASLAAAYRCSRYAAVCSKKNAAPGTQQSAEKKNAAPGTQQSAAKKSLPQVRSSLQKPPRCVAPARFTPLQQKTSRPGPILVLP